MPFDSEDFHSDLEFDPIEGAVGQFSGDSLPFTDLRRGFRDRLDRADPVGSSRNAAGRVHRTLLHAETGPRTFSFAEAAERLQGVFDLNAARAAAVEQQERWGLVQALIDAGVVADRDGYRALFDQVTFTEAGLKLIRESISEGTTLLPIFNPGHLSLFDGFHILFVSKGIPYDCESHNAYTDVFESDHLSSDDGFELRDFRVITPPIECSSREDLLRAYSTGCMPSSNNPPSVVFTSEKRIPDFSHVRDCYRSFPLHFLDPISDWILCRMQFDASLGSINPNTYKADLIRLCDYTMGGGCNQLTLYPYFVNSSGSILASGFHNGRVVISEAQYSFPFSKNFGPRLALR